MKDRSTKPNLNTKYSELGNKDRFGNQRYTKKKKY